jgi:hypothetical protein
MGPGKDTSFFWVRHIPIGVLLIFWAVYVIVEIAYRRYDVLTSTMPIGLFIIGYLVSRIDLIRKPKI